MEFWDTILSALPPWADEMAAITLIIFSIVSFLSLLNVSADASLAAAWSSALTSLFGIGGIIVCAGLFALGVIILLPKLGIVICFPARRILAIEIVFLSMLALLHLAAGDSAAEFGWQGGRWAGRLGAERSGGLFGSSVAIAVYGTLLVVGIALAIGIRRQHVTSILTRLRAGLIWRWPRIGNRRMFPARSDPLWMMHSDQRRAR